MADVRVTGGTENDSAEDVLRKHLSRAFKGKAWEALIAAIADGDEYVRSLAQAAYDQLFIISAESKYLDQRGSNEGVPRPKGVGMDDESYRKFIIALTNNKLTVDAVLEMLEVFYGAESVRAYVETLHEPYNLVPDTTLSLLFDGQAKVDFTVRANDYHDASAAAAEEVASAFTMQAQEQGSTAFAEAHTNYATGETHVRFYSGSRGIRGSIRYAGGELAQVFQIPGQRTASYSGAWTLSRTGTTVRMTSASAIALDWRAGDILVLRGAWGLNAGSFVITKVYRGAASAWVEFSNENAVEGTFTVASNQTLAWAPTVFSLGERAAAVSKSKDAVRVMMPATTQVVRRTEKTAAYLALPVYTLGITSASVSIVGGRVCVTLSAPGAFTVGDKVILDGLLAGDTDPSTPLNYWPGGTLNGLGTVVTGGTGGCVVDMGPALSAITSDPIPPPPPPAAPTVTLAQSYFTAAGDSITIDGTNLSDATVSFAGGAAGTIASNTDSEIVVTVPAGATSGAITVTTLGGSAGAGTLWRPLLTDDASTLSHAYVANGALRDTKSVSWSKIGAPVANALAALGGSFSGSAESVGSFSTSAYYNLGTGSDVYDPAGDFIVTVVYYDTGAANTDVLISNGSFLHDGWYVQNRTSITQLVFSDNTVFGDLPISAGAHVISFGRAGTTWFYKADKRTTLTLVKSTGYVESTSDPMRLGAYSNLGQYSLYWSGKIYEVRLQQATPTTGVLDAIHAQLIP